MHPACNALLKDNHTLANAQRQCRSLGPQSERAMRLRVAPALGPLSSTKRTQFHPRNSPIEP
jgi:hypothetical protein